MNYRRVALAALAAWVVDAVYGFIVYGNVLTSDFARYPNIYRAQASQGAYMPFLFLGTLLALLVAAYVYAKGYEGGSGLQEGMRFGALIGLLVLGYVGLVNYATMNLGRRMAGSMAVASVVEWVVAGIVIGAIYKPAAQSKARHAAML
jgi:hypothetical protein